MSVIPKLASSLGRRDEVPNQELAKEIADKNDKAAVKELVENLKSKSRDIQSDCIKVLYETGELNPELIAGYAEEFVALLDHKNNRLQWGAMSAIDSITTQNPRVVYGSLSKIIKASDKGSVITKDHAVNILIKLCAGKLYADEAFSLLIEQLLSCPTNQLPMYAERAVTIVSEKNKGIFTHTLTSRLGEIEKDTKRMRVEKVIKKLNA